MTSQRRLETEDIPPACRRTCGQAGPATPIRLPSGSVKWPTTGPVGARSGAHLPLPAEALGP